MMMSPFQNCCTTNNLPDPNGGTVEIVKLLFVYCLDEITY